MGEAAIDIWRERAQEIKQCFNSFRYFIEEYCYIEDKITKRPMLFKLWPAQLKILPVFVSALLLIILKARQLGLTWLCAAYALWMTIFHPMKLVVVISAKGEWAVEFLDRCYFMLQRLPKWMYPQALKDTTEVLTFRHKDGNSTIKSLTTTEAGAQSKTPDLLILDETCWNPYIKSIYNSSKPGIEAAGGRIIIISNSIKYAPGWAWTRTIYINSMRSLNRFKRVFMPWWDRPGRGKTFIAQEIAGGMDEEDAAQHYPATEEEAISTALGSYFGKSLARHGESITDGVRGNIKPHREDSDNPEVEFEEDPRGILEIWRYPYWMLDGWDGLGWLRRYAIGGDVSEGLGQTYSTWYVIDRLYDEMVARMRSNRVDAYAWAHWGWLLSIFYDKALICPERTGAGQTTVKRLLELNANQYVQLVAGKLGSPVTKKFGWNNGSNTAKHELCGDLKQWFTITDGGFYCGILLDEASTYIRHENGQLDPEEGAFGDCVIGAGCAVQASKFIDGKPEKLKEPVTGWLKDYNEGRIK